MTSKLSSTLLKGEILHESIQLTLIPRKGRGYITTNEIQPGTVLIRARGFLNCSDDGQPNAAELLKSIIQDIFGVVATKEEEKLILFKKMIDLFPENMEILQNLSNYNPNQQDIEEISRLFQEIQPNLLQQEYVHFQEFNPHLFLAKCDMNSFHVGLFPLAAGMNHSCLQNCSASLVYLEEEECYCCEVRSLETIPSNCELTINYLHQRNWYVPRENRREILSRNYCFLCECPRCSRSTTKGMNDIYLEAVYCQRENCKGICLKNTEEDQIVTRRDENIKKRRLLKEENQKEKEWFRCTECEQITDVNEVEKYVSLVYEKLKDAKQCETLEKMILLLQNAVTPSILHKQHWLIYAAYSNLSEVCFDLALECVHQGETEEKIVKYQNLALESTKNLLECSEAVLPENEYYISELYEKLGWMVRSILKDDEKAIEYEKKAFRIRDICSWDSF